MQFEKQKLWKSIFSAWRNSTLCLMISVCLLSMVMSYFFNNLIMLRVIVFEFTIFYTLRTLIAFYIIFENHPKRNFDKIVFTESTSLIIYLTVKASNILLYEESHLQTTDILNEGAIIIFAELITLIFITAYFICLAIINGLFRRTIEIIENEDDIIVNLPSNTSVTLYDRYHSKSKSYQKVSIKGSKTHIDIMIKCQNDRRTDNPKD